MTAPNAPLTPDQLDAIAARAAADEQWLREQAAKAAESKDGQQRYYDTYMDGPNFDEYARERYRQAIADHTAAEARYTRIADALGEVRALRAALTVSDERVEAAARALSDTNNDIGGGSNGVTWDAESPVIRDHYRTLARRALTAALSGASHPAEAP